MGPLLFGSIGWLFADLMLALAMAFLIANTVGTEAPAAPPTTTVPPTTTTLPPPPDRLEREPVKLSVRANHDGLLSGDRSTIRAARAAVRRTTRAEGLDGRRVGMVLSFGTGAANAAGIAHGKRVADAFNRHVLEGLGREGYLFKDSAYEDFFTGGDANTVEFWVFVFDD